MANNRLYIGNIETRECFCISKSDENNWRDVGETELKGINDILSSDFIWQPTSLILFTESDSFWYDKFFNNNQIRTT